MSNGAKWLLGLIILGLVALLLSLVGPWNAKVRSADMGAQLNTQLNENGFAWANVEMSGNVAKLTGEAKSDAARDGALDFVRNAKCESCGGDKAKTWHVAEDAGITVQKAPTVSPYTFSATKADNGRVVLNGYVPSTDVRENVRAQAETLFPGNWDDKTIKVASGQPNEDWDDVIGMNLKGLSQLDYGKVSMIDTVSTLTGGVNDMAVNEAVSGAYALPAPYNGSASITTKAAPAPVLTSQTDCQALFNDIKLGSKINFAYNKAEIDGEASFDLLNKIAEAANQCASFRIEVGGHTDSDGSNDYNQWLSEARATTVVLYLADAGVDRSRMSAIGYGEEKPVATNATPAGKEQNRRIEFTVTRSE